MPYYAVMHGAFVAMVIYMVYIRGLIPLKYVSDVYEIVEQPALWPVILGELLARIDVSSWVDTTMAPRTTLCAFLCGLVRDCGCILSKNSRSSIPHLNQD